MISQLGAYGIAWAAGPNPDTWVTVVTVALTFAFVVSVCALGFLVLLADQDDAMREWQERHGR